MKDVGVAVCEVGCIAGSHSHCLMFGEWKLRGSVSRSKACACEAGFVQSLMKFTLKTKAMLINSPERGRRRGKGRERRGERERGVFV